MGKVTGVLSVIGPRENIAESKLLQNPVWAAATKRGQTVLQRAWKRHLHVYLVFVTATERKHKARVVGAAKMTSDVTKAPRNWQIPGRWDKMPCFNVEWLVLDCEPKKAAKTLPLEISEDVGIAKVSHEQEAGVVQYLLASTHQVANRSELNYLWQIVKPRDASPHRKRKMH